MRETGRPRDRKVPVPRRRENNSFQNDSPESPTFSWTLSKIVGWHSIYFSTPGLSSVTKEFLNTTRPPARLYSWSQEWNGHMVFLPSFGFSHEGPLGFSWGRVEPRRVSRGVTQDSGGGRGRSRSLSSRVVGVVRDKETVL